MRREGSGIVVVQGEGRMAAVCRVSLRDPIVRKDDKGPIPHSGCAVFGSADHLVSKRSEELLKANLAAGQDQATSGSQQTTETMRVAR